MTRLVVAGFVIVSGFVAALQGLRVNTAVEKAQTENLAHREQRQVLAAQVFELGDRLLDEFERRRQLASGAVRALPGWENQCLALPARNAGDTELLAWLAAQLTRLEELESHPMAAEPTHIDRQGHPPLPPGSRVFPRR